VLLEVAGDTQHRVHRQAGKWNEGGRAVLRHLGGSAHGSPTHARLRYLVVKQGQPLLQREGLQELARRLKRVSARLPPALTCSAGASIHQEVKQPSFAAIGLGGH